MAFMNSKRFILPIALLFAGVMSAFAQSLPNVKVKTDTGATITTHSLLQGKPLIISFWGVTCKPCITELNTLNELQEEWLEEVDFDIVAVSIDDSRFTARARSMVKGNGWGFTCVFDENQDLKRAMNVSFTPQVFIVDAQGEIVYSHSGYTPGNELELLETLKEMKGQKEKPAPKSKKKKR